MVGNYIKIVVIGVVQFAIAEIFEIAPWVSQEVFDLFEFGEFVRRRAKVLGLEFGVHHITFTFEVRVAAAVDRIEHKLFERLFGCVLVRSYIVVIHNQKFCQVVIFILWFVVDHEFPSNFFTFMFERSLEFIKRLIVFSIRILFSLVEKGSVHL